MVSWKELRSCKRQLSKGRENWGGINLGASLLGRGGKFSTFERLTGMCLLTLAASPLGGGIPRDCGRLL